MQKKGQGLKELIGGSFVWGWSKFLRRKDKQKKIWGLRWLGREEIVIQNSWKTIYVNKALDGAR